MGAIGGLLGLDGGANGTGFSGPQGIQLNAANISNPTTAAQVGSAYSGSQNSLASQQALLQALQAQNGIGNQSQVYGQLQGVANGTGPNPAQAMLSQATGQNVSNQAALMAGQRGAGANVGLIARQAGQQGAGIQQNAAGQAATMQAQQQLNALGAAGNMANQMAGQQVGATADNTRAQLSEQQALLGAQQGYNSQQVQNQAALNSSNVSMQNSINSANAGLAGKGMEGQQGLVGGVLGGVGAALMADGGTVGVPASPASGPQSFVGKFMSGWSPAASGSEDEQPETPSGPAQPLFSRGASGLQQGVSSFAQGIGAALMAQGGSVGSKLMAGGGVPGKAAVSGNSQANDKVKALLSPGELVVDRETMKDPGQAGQAARFLAAVIEAKKRGKK